MLTSSAIPALSLAPGLHAFARSAELTGFLALKRPRSHCRGTLDVSQRRCLQRLERCKTVSHFLSEGRVTQADVLTSSAIPPFTRSRPSRFCAVGRAHWLARLGTPALTLSRDARCLPASMPPTSRALQDSLTLSERRTSHTSRRTHVVCHSALYSLPAFTLLRGRPSSLACSPWNARAHTVAGRSMSPSVDASNVSSAARQSPTSGVTVERSSCCLSRPLSLVLHRPAKPTGFLA